MTKEYSIIFLNISKKRNSKKHRICEDCKGKGVKKATKKNTVYCITCDGWGFIK